ncbi:MAG: DUF2335 domain-containing protein [Candidatus Sumerlaeota bacterium]|nr:DUF2335 domain-containing protein [Candidatus Sumerlaeota bacterium]
MNPDNSLTPEAQTPALPGEEESLPRASNPILIAHRLASGPIPDPDTLKQYDSVLPGAAERIFKIFEANGAHRREIERMASQTEALETKRGQIFAFAIALAGIVAGAIVGALGREITGSFIGVGGLAAIVYAFIRGRSRTLAPSRELSKK